MGQMMAQVKARGQTYAQVSDQAVGSMQSTVSSLPRSSLSASPQVHPSADIHEFSLVEGDVSIYAGSMVAPGTAVTAEAGASVVVGSACALMPGSLVEGVCGAKVMGPDGRTTSVWIGDRTLIAHKALVHSPAFIGADCFVGFRSTVFNARLGDGCVVMMHALVQDVEVPPGKCVPSGSVITSQHQADQLPDVRPEDLEFAREVLGTRTALAGAGQAKGHQLSSSRLRLVPTHSAVSSASPVHGAHSPPFATSGPSSATSEGYPAAFANAQSSTHSNRTSYATREMTMQAQRLAPEIVQQVRQYLRQGYRIGMEHADARRYRSGVWQTCSPIQDSREQVVFEALERCLAEHVGEYVRMFGIDPQAKRRVGVVTVQRPDGKPLNLDGHVAAAANGSAPAAARGGGSAAGSASLSAEVVQQVRNLLRSGYIIGTEHADARRYRSNVWKSCSPIEVRNEQEVFSRLEHCLTEHTGEYVRMFGIDPQAKRRMATTTIQRADGQPVEVSPVNPGAASAVSGQGYRQSAGYGGAHSAHHNNGAGNSAAAQLAGEILASGNQIGVEVADARRYRSGIWQTAPSCSSIAQLQSCLSQNSDKYVRIFSVNPGRKSRGSATTVQKPGQAGSSAGQSSAEAGRDPINANPPHYDDPAFLNRGATGGYGTNGSGMDTAVMDQVTQLVNQGYRIAVEFADQRRFRSGIWQTGASIEARRPAEAISALGKQLAQHQGDYVRLVGIDPQAKRRVLEATIQRP